MGYGELQMSKSDPTGDRGHDKPRFSSRHGGYREERFYTSGRRHEDHSQDSCYLSCGSRDFNNLGFPRYGNRHHDITSHSWPGYHHSRPSNHHSQPGFSRNHHSRPTSSRHR